jgi:hypothetical protein
MMKKKVAKRLCKYMYLLTTYPTNARNKKFSMLFVNLPLVVILLVPKIIRQVQLLFGGKCLV